LLFSGYAKTVNTAESLRRLVGKLAGLDVARYGSDMIIWGVLIKSVGGSRPCHPVPRRFIKSTWITIVDVHGF